MRKVERWTLRINVLDSTYYTGNVFKIIGSQALNRRVPYPIGPPQIFTNCNPGNPLLDRRQDWDMALVGEERIRRGN